MINLPDRALCLETLRALSNPEGINQYTIGGNKGKAVEFHSAHPTGGWFGSGSEGPKGHEIYTTKGGRDITVKAENASRIAASASKNAENDGRRRSPLHENASTHHDNARDLHEKAAAYHDRLGNEKQAKVHEEKASEHADRARYHASHSPLSGTD